MAYGINIFNKRNKKAVLKAIEKDWRSFSSVHPILSKDADVLAHYLRFCDTVATGHILSQGDGEIIEIHPELITNENFMSILEISNFYLSDKVKSKIIEIHPELITSENLSYVLRVHNSCLPQDFKQNIIEIHPELITSENFVSILGIPNYHLSDEAKSKIIESHLELITSENLFCVFGVCDVCFPQDFKLNIIDSHPEMMTSENFMFILRIPNYYLSDKVKSKIIESHPELITSRSLLHVLEVRDVYFSQDFKQNIIESHPEMITSENFMSILEISNSDLSDKVKSKIIESHPELITSRSLLRVLEVRDVYLSQDRKLNIIDSHPELITSRSLLRVLEVRDVYLSQDRKLNIIDSHPEMITSENFMSILVLHDDALSDEVKSKIIERYPKMITSENFMSILEISNSDLSDKVKSKIIERYPKMITSENFMSILVLHDDALSDEAKLNIIESHPETITSENFMSILAFPNDGAISDEIKSKIIEIHPELITLRDSFDIFTYVPKLVEKHIRKTEQQDQADKHMTALQLHEKIIIYNAQRRFKEYVINNYDNISKERLYVLENIMQLIEESNSNELGAFKDEFFSQIIEADNPIKAFEDIEKVFVKNNLPMAGKLFLCFKILYPNFYKIQFDFSEGSRMSPELLMANPQESHMELVLRNKSKVDKRFQIVFNDLLRVSSQSNSRSLLKYVENIERGNEIYLGLNGEQVNLETLSKEDAEILKIFVSHLETLYFNSSLVDKKDISKYSLGEKIEVLSKEFIAESRFDLPDRIVRSFCYLAGFDSLRSLKETIINSALEADQRGRMREKKLQESPLKLEPGDFIRSIGNFDALGGSLNNGNVCKEFLGPINGTSYTDTTPLDIDITLVRENRDIFHAIDGTPTGWGFGNVFIILKKNHPCANITRDENGNLLPTTYDPKKFEIFGTKTIKGGYETHWGIRTGIGSTDIDYILYKKNAEIDAKKPYNADGSVNYTSHLKFDDLPIIKFEIARNGFYIPVVDLAGRVIFTSKEYDELRSKMMGLSYYGTGKYELDRKSLVFSEVTIGSTFIPGIEATVNEVVTDKANTTNKLQIVRQYIEKGIKDPKLELDIDEVLYTLVDDISSGNVQLISTGSTGRGTNVPNDSDFDFMLKLDRIHIGREDTTLSIMGKLREIFPGDDIPGRNNRFRRKKIIIPDLDEPIEVDVSLEQKKNNMVYLTEMALEDRLNSIFEQHPQEYPFVVANIVFAKRLLKAAGAYKSSKSDSNQGGLGGVGVENWILQNGGSFEKAAQSFVEHYERSGSFEKFKENYQIWDFGGTHEPRDKGGVLYSYDEFVSDNMNESGYQKMYQALKVYVKSRRASVNKLSTIIPMTEEINVSSEGQTR